MKTSCPLKCINCGKEYNRQSSYDKHKLLCCDDSNPPNIVNKLKDATISEAIELNRTPSTLQQTIEELIKSNNQLKTEICELKKWAQIQKRKIVIIDWLNKNCAPNQDYKEYINQIVITRTDLETVFKTNLVDGIQEILQNYIENTDEKECPIKSFDKKENKIYGYNEHSQWELISSTNFDKIILPISKKIINEFKKWQDENESNLYTEEQTSTKYLEYVKKVMGGNMTIEKIQKSIHKKLYNYLKKNLQNIVEYEFS